MSDSEKKFKLSHELRILVASLLSVLVILGWAHYFGPKPPINRPQTNQPAQTAPSTSNPSVPNQSTSGPGIGGGAAAQHGRSGVVSAAPKTNIPVRSENQERGIVVEGDLYRVEFSNRGGVVKSWQLRKYMDDAKPPHVLDVVHPEEAQQTGGWPFALVTGDSQIESALNSGLYQVSSTSATIQAPADLNFTWSNGHIEVTKHFHFDNTYVVRAETSVKVDGLPVNAELAWLGGFGDLTVTNPRPIDTVSEFYNQNGKLTLIPAKKLPDQPRIETGLDWAGIEDRYFAAVFLPPTWPAPGSLEAREWKAWHPVKVEGKDEAEPVPQLATSETAQPLNLRVYVGPKDYDILKKISPPLQSLVNFGWLEFIADPLFHALKWIHEYVPNWGWSIVVLTLILNMVLFPLRISGYKTAQKMQRVAPEIKQIQEKYKKYSMRDPRKAEMNKEVMAVYSREGINPVGGCIPQLIQFPIWFGLYRALYGTIELRHAHWFWWITDLSAKDPYYILPVLMGVSMYFSSKMTPMTSTDPQQQAMMKFMPLTMAVMFMVIPYPSGLAVYILTSGLVGVVQQWYLTRTHPLPAQTKQLRGGKSKNKKQ